MVEEEQFKPNEILEQGAIEAPKKIMYYRPPFLRRILSNLLDIVFFALVLSSLVIAARAIVSNTDEFKRNMNTLDTIRLDSGIYLKDKSGNITDIITYLNSDTAFNSEYKKYESTKAIDKYLSYAQSVCFNTSYQEILSDYNTYRLKDTMVYKNNGSIYDNIPLFVKDENNKIVENPELFAPGTYVPNIYGYYYDKAYAPYIDSHLQGFLVTKIPGFYELTQYLSLMMIFAVVLPSYLFTGILIYYVPTLIFRRGRSTFGKALYRIGFVDSRVLSPSFGRITARFAIFYIGELVLSLVTFGLPYLLSFSLMIFSKNKQGFPDYMLGLTEIDMSRTKIYKSFDEVDLENINPHQKAVDFKVPNFD